MQIKKNLVAEFPQVIEKEILLHRRFSNKARAVLANSTTPAINQTVRSMYHSWWEQCKHPNAWP
jgi:hypothetical protein